MQGRLAAEVDGWLISPGGHSCYRFHHDPNSCKHYSYVFVDKWTADGGTPSQLQCRSKLLLDDALELCGELLLSGWDKLKGQFQDVTVVESAEESAA